MRFIMNRVDVSLTLSTATAVLLFKRIILQLLVSAPECKPSQAPRQWQWQQCRSRRQEAEKGRGVVDLASFIDRALYELADLAIVLLLIGRKQSSCIGIGGTCRVWIGQKRLVGD
jgi:hypothetical protein